MRHLFGRENQCHSDRSLPSPGSPLFSEWEPRALTQPLPWEARRLRAALSELDAAQRREFHEALLDAHTSKICLRAGAAHPGHLSLVGFQRHDSLPPRALEAGATACSGMAVEAMIS
jgi:hypothetical protein